MAVGVAAADVGGTVGAGVVWVGADWTMTAELLLEVAVGTGWDLLQDINNRQLPRMIQTALAVLIITTLCYVLFHQRAIPQSGVKLQRRSPLVFLERTSSYPKRWSGRRDSNPRLSPWQGDALPLSHFRSFIAMANYIEKCLGPESNWRHRHFQCRALPLSYRGLLTSYYPPL